MKNISILILFLFVISCGNVGKILRNEKIKTTDEFLIKKKDPLILPPDFDKLPAPESIGSANKTEENELKKILNKATDTKKNKKKSSSIEDSILNRLPK